jgi:pimeloyl-ACP methyl ester carboxylesterase
MQLYYRESGWGSVPLVCVHGWGCNSEQFMDLAERLASHFRLYLIDLPGHGNTALENFQPSFQNFTDVLVEFVIARVPGHPILLGHSMGGVLSLLAGAQIHARAIINLDGALPAANATLAGQKLIASKLNEPDPVPWFEEFFRKAFFLPEEQDEKCRAILEDMCRMPLAILHFLPEQIGWLDARSTLPSLQSPVLYVASAHPRFDEERARQLNPRFSFSHISSAGHFLHVYAAEKVAELVRRFVNFDK